MSSRAERVYEQGFRGGLKPDPDLTVSQWADKYRMLPAKASAEPGRWRTERTPYLREIMDCMSAASPVEEVDFMKGSQIGGTEAIQNALGYIIDMAPGPAMVVQPTVEVAKRYSRQRLEPLFEETPQLHDKVAPSKSRSKSNSVLAKDFVGGLLIITGANSAVGLRSMPAKFLLLDEVDAYPLNVDDEGDPIKLAEARQRTFARRKRIKVSSPKVAGFSRIENAFEAGDQRYYHVPCPHCGHTQKLVFSQLKWKQLGLDPRDAMYECVACEKLIENHHKTQMLAFGRWIPEKPDADPRRRSYHLSSLYSPVGWLSWGEIAEMWEEAQKDADKLRVFVNTVLGETWQERGEAPEWQRLYDRRESYKIGTVPAGVGFLTAGVDVQKDRLVYEVVGWGPGKESWSIDAGVLPGVTAAKEVWAQLEALRLRTFTTASGAEMPILSLAVDSGYNTQIVYAWARTKPMPAVIAIKGVEQGAVLVGAPSRVDITVGGRRMKRGYKIWPIVGGIAKSEFYGFLVLDAPTTESGDPYPPGFCHFPEYGEDVFRQLTAEQLVTHRKRTGHVTFTWELVPGRENHWLDARVYARAAASVLGLDRFRERDWEHLGVVSSKVQRSMPPPAPPPTQNQPRAPRSGRRRGGWLRRGE